MNIKELKQKLIWQMTGEEMLEIEVNGYAPEKWCKEDFAPLRTNPVNGDAPEKCGGEARTT